MNQMKLGIKFLPPSIQSFGGIISLLPGMTNAAVIKYNTEDGGMTNAAHIVGCTGCLTFPNNLFAITDKYIDICEIAGYLGEIPHLLYFNQRQNIFNLFFEPENMEYFIRTVLVNFVKDERDISIYCPEKIPLRRITFSLRFPLDKKDQRPSFYVWSGLKDEHGRPSKSMKQPIPHSCVFQDDNKVRLPEVYWKRKGHYFLKEDDDNFVTVIIDPQWSMRRELLIYNPSEPFDLDDKLANLRDFKIHSKKALRVEQPELW